MSNLRLMRKNIYKALLFLVGIFACNSIVAQSLEGNRWSFATIKSLQITPSNDSLGYEILPLLGGKKLNVSFDILDDEIHWIGYRFIYCDRNWKEDDNNMIALNITGNMVLDGNNVESSFNTSVSYQHYSFSFPNDEVEFMLSGNYVLQVYEEVGEQGREYILFQKRFVVTEQLIEIQANVKRPDVVQYIDDHQQIEMKIIPHGFDLSSFDKDLFVCYRQNGRWDKTIKGIQPNHISGDGTLVFNDNRNALFLGGAEFHQFDFKNFNYASYPVDYFEHEYGKYTAVLKPDKIQPSYIYKDNGDLNGKYCIAISQHFDKNTSADYAKVHFTLPYFKNYYDTLSPYVCGAFNDWALSKENKMTYNDEKKQFEADILLKQGYYGYTYIFASDDLKTIDYSSIDGSFYQTENDYEIFVYYFDYNLGYDRCIGYKLINSGSNYGN